MVPLDEETVDPDRPHHRPPLPGPADAAPPHRRPAEFLFTHHGRRLAADTPSATSSTRAAHDAGLGHITPHQLRHTYATALVNAGVSLQALMALLGHVSAEMSLRYGRLFDTTVTRRIRAGPGPGQSHIGTARPATGRTQPAAGRHHRRRDWKETPAASSPAWPAGSASAPPPKAPAPTPTSANTAPASAPTPAHLPVLAAQRVDAEALAPTPKPAAGSARPTRHRRLIARLDTLISEAQTG